MQGKNWLAALFVILMGVLGPSVLPAQDKKEVNLAAAPPKVLLLEHEQVYPGKAEDRRKLEESFSFACDRLEAPRFWVDLESLTGEPDALVFSSFDSYEQMEMSNAEWTQFLAARPDLQRTDEETRSLIGGRRRIIALRRDDLGYLADNIDLSEARFLHVLEVRLFPGRESDFAEAFKILADAHARVQAGTPWVVYEVDAGLPAPAFLILSPMAELKERDDLLSQAGSLADAEGDQGGDSLKKIARESFATTESTVYAVNPGMSHVSKAFAATDLDYWMHRVPDAKPEAKSEGKSDSKPKPKPPQKPTT
jgi:hypothetical protein